MCAKSKKEKATEKEIKRKKEREKDSTVKTVESEQCTCRHNNVPVRKTV